MPILTVVLVLIAVGVVLWLINKYIPMQSTIKNLLNAVVVIVVVIWLFKIFGVWGSLQNLHT
jgi:VIT1/CCC1 family predicted Fe2+/Mn2+ transporter